MTKYDHLDEPTALRQISLLEALTNSETTLTKREEELLDALRYMLDLAIDGMNKHKRAKFFQRSTK